MGYIARATTAFLMAVTMTSVAEAEEALPDCSAETAGMQCVAERAQVGAWDLLEVVPPVGSQNSLILTSASFETLPGIFGRESPATLRLSCIENTTQIEVRFAENYMSDIGALGTLVYRLDDDAPVQIAAEASTENFALGLYSGQLAIPLLASMIEKERLLVSATSFTGRTLTANFSIQEVQQAVQPLRELCTW